MKRHLTSEEIEDICQQIQLNPSIPFDTAVAVREGLMRGIRNQLVDIQIYPEGIPELKREVMMEYHRSMLQPGEMVGVQAATSIGEPVTQMSLNAFHYSGISTIGIASGVPRVEEILNASKKQKMSIMNLYFKNRKTIEEARQHVYHNITEVYLSGLATTVTSRYVNSYADLGEGADKWYGIFFSIFPNYILDEEGFLMNWMIRFELDRELLYKHRISTLDVAQKIEEAFRDLYVVASPDTVGIVDVYIDFKCIKMKKAEENEFERFKATGIEVRCIKNVVIPYLKDILIAGVQGVEDVQLQEEKGEWAVMTKGTNLYAAFQDEELDYTRCRSSDIWEVYRVLGVEACRQFIIEEFYKVLSAGGASVGRRHIELLADSMTYQGKISSVNRYGIDRNQIGAMAKASFEESVRNFFIAAVNGETDQMGVSASLMAGKLVKCGTGYVDMILNEEMLRSVKLPSPAPIPKPPAPKPVIQAPVPQPVVQASRMAPASMLPSMLTGRSAYSNVTLPGLRVEPVKEKTPPPTKISFMRKTKPKPVQKDVIVDFEEDD
jgi:DNA-directed RNA polymerase II subunit RPB1